MSDTKLSIINVALPENQIHLKGCACNVCLTEPSVSLKSSQESGSSINCFEEFLKHFPSDFPLSIEPTTFYKPSNSHLHYFNNGKEKQFIVQNKVNRILSSFTNSQNIHIYGSKVSKIVSKSEAIEFIKRNDIRTRKNSSLSSMNKTFNSSAFSENQYIQYIQNYCTEVPLRVDYDSKKINSKLDNILREYVEDQIMNFSKDKVYTINQEFWQWVYKEYGEQVFAHFVTEFYVNVHRFYSRHTITKGAFFWILERHKKEFGDNVKISQEISKSKKAAEERYFVITSKKLNFQIRLLNIKDLSIEYHQNIKTFQEEYQEMILQRLRTEPENVRIKDNGLGTQKKAYVYQARLGVFQSKVRNMFLNEQNKALKKVEKEKQFEGKHDSDSLARLLIPNMGGHTCLRQILNDQHAFQKLVLMQNKKKECERLKKARNYLIRQRKNIEDKNYSSRNSVSQSSRNLSQVREKRARIKSEI